MAAWRSALALRRREQPAPAVNVNSLYMVLRELVGLMSSARAEVRALRTENKEMKMNIDDLSRNVLALIDECQTQKAKTDQATAVFAVPDLQPQIDELNSKVVAALGMLRGAPTTVDTSQQGFVPAPTDPNAPFDPNAPVT